MSTKRQATTELNHENWDQEDVTDKDDASTGYQIASKDVLEKRVIRTARRRIQNTDSEGKKSVFSGFSGFNKPPPSSFDFLANLTNGQKPVGSSLFGSSNQQTDNKSAATPMFSMSGATTSTLKMNESSVFGTPFSNNAAQSQFASTPSSTVKENPQTGQTSTPTTIDNSLKQNVKTSPFITPPAPSAIFGSSTPTPTDTSFKQNVSSSPFSTSQEKLPVFGMNIPTSKATSSIQNVISSPFSTSQTSKTIFGTNAAKSIDTSVKQNVNLSSFNTPQANATIFGANSDSNVMNKPLPTNSTLFKIQSSSSQESTEPKKLDDDKPISEHKLRYHTMLKGLNESVSDWIKKHVDMTPLCILSPIFNDYENYLKEIKAEFERNKQASKALQGDTQVDSTPLAQATSSENIKVPNVFTNTTATTSVFATNTQEKASFSFGINNNSAAVTSAITTPSTGLSFGFKSSPSSISNTSLTMPGSNGSTPFSFGNGKPFSFNSNIKKPEEPANQDNENEDEPPKVEFTPVVEENSVYDKKCKIFIKKDGNFIDKGVGTLYVKKIEESNKHQLLVRANTNLGSVLLNLILSSSIPTQRMGKNNVMMVCIPTPESKPPPVPILIRVKTPEEADDLLSKLDTFKA